MVPGVPKYGSSSNTPPTPKSSVSKERTTCWKGCCGFVFRLLKGAWNNLKELDTSRPPMLGTPPKKLNQRTIRALQTDDNLLKMSLSPMTVKAWYPPPPPHSDSVKEFMNPYADSQEGDVSLSSLFKARRTLDFRCTWNSVSQSRDTGTFFDSLIRLQLKHTSNPSQTELEKAARRVVEIYAKLSIALKSNNSSLEAALSVLAKCQSIELAERAADHWVKEQKSSLLPRSNSEVELIITQPNDTDSPSDGTPKSSLDD